MKYSNKFALTGLLFTSCSAFAAIPAEGWYGGLMGGLSYSPSINSQAPNPGALIALNSLVNPVVGNGLPTNPVVLANPAINPLALASPGFINVLINNTLTTFPLNTSLTTGSLTHGVGGDGGGQIGYRICNFRFEGQLLFNYAPFSRVQVAGVTIARHVTPTNPIRMKGQTALGAGLFNAYYDFYDEENDPTWVPYLGLGIGYAYVQNSITFTVPYLFTSSIDFNVKNNKSAPIGQAILGISYYYSDNLAIGLDYRYVTTKSMSRNNNSTSTTNTITNFNHRVQANTINLNFNYWFQDN